MRFARLLSVVIGLWVTAAGAIPTDLAVRVDKLDTLKTQLALSNLTVDPTKFKNLKIAVLDNGFAGVGKGGENPAGKRFLPKNTEVIEDYPGVRKDPLDYRDPHGLHMAHIIWALTNYYEDDKGVGPKFRLYNSRGHEQFRAAVDNLITWKADIVLFSQNWETMGNFDGTGFIDDAVQEAVDEGVIWINAAGNYGGMVYNGPVKVAESEDKKSKLVKFGDNWFLRFKNNVDENDVQIILSWNSFHPGSEPIGTDKDLNLALYQESEPGKYTDTGAIYRSEKKQVTRSPKDDSETIHAREKISARLSAGGDKRFLIAVTVKGGSFDPNRDRLRVTIKSDKAAFTDRATGKRKDSVEFLDATDDGEIMVPADGAGLTVGDISEKSAKGPTRDGRGKPDVLMRHNSVTFTDKKTFFGTSYAAALLAGVVTNLKAAAPGLRQHHILKFRTGLPADFWKDLGWSNEIWRLHPEIQRQMAAHDLAPVGVQSIGANAYVAGCRKDPLASPLLAKVSDATKKAREDHRFFIYVRETPTWQTVKDPDERRKYPDREVVVSQQWVYDHSVKTDGRLIYDVYTPRLVKNTRTIPGEYYTVPGQLRRVPGTPEYSLEAYTVTVASKKMPWEQYGGEPSKFVELVQVKMPGSRGSGRVIDGSAATEIIWSTPTMSQLTSTVGGR